MTDRPPHRRTTTTIGSRQHDRAGERKFQARKRRTPPPPHKNYTRRPGCFPKGCSYSKGVF